MRERLNLAGGKGMLAVAEEVATRTGRPLGEVMRVLRRIARQRPTIPSATRDPVRETGALQEAKMPQRTWQRCVTSATLLAQHRRGW